MQNKLSFYMLHFGLLCLASIAGYSQTMKVEKKPNVLFIAVDDLKPLLGCYGDAIIKTPNIDRIAKRGTVFMSNYCQQAVCGPTRASIMTGMRPDYTKVWDLKTKMRDMNPNILTMPQHFAADGYSTQGIGKVYDPRCVDNKSDAPSWTVPFYNSSSNYFPTENGRPALGRYQLKETKELAEKYRKEGLEKGLNQKDLSDFVVSKVRPTVEYVDVPDNAYEDGANALQSKDILVQLKQKNQPFFLAVGFSKPHLPFVAPKKYWDMYNRDQLPLAPHQEKPLNAVDIAFHDAGEIRAYTDIPQIIETTKQKNFGLTLPVDKQRELIHGYYAAVSYMDAQVGILLNTLDSLGLTENTIIVLWGDHGWHLGDHNLWCKHSNFEQATRTPMIISAPGIKPSVTNSSSEFVDIFPTLCELAKIEVPVHLDGKSQVAVMKNPALKVKEFAVSQYPRSMKKEQAAQLGYSNTSLMGYSIRNDRYRFTVWMGNNFRSNLPYNEKLLVATELYDYEKDPLEKVNVASEKQYAAVSKEMKMQMLVFFKSQERSN
ncbi:sulfatase [Lacibacter sp. H375]|uniref:sulfatase n=1 Tax=Lacibacter sp. H375 TaxID=3133424 RepID=UPI0030C10305